MDYKNGKIYAIRSPHTDKVYIGSTTQPLSKRLYKHKHNHKNWKVGKYHYVTSFEILEVGDAYIELIKDYPCNSKEELNREEGITIRATDCVNKLIAGRTQKEYVKYWYENKNGKQKKKECDKKYYQDNKEQILEQHKKYYYDNIEERKKYEKKRNSIKVGCRLCKCVVIARFFKAHERTKKHQENAEQDFVKALRRATLDDPDFTEYFKQFEYVVQDEK